MRNDQDRMGQRGGERIVVCEDDAEIRDLLAAFLAAEGYRVDVAGDGDGLMALLADRTVDLVILDWMLPGEDGLSLCRRLRAAGGPPVLMLTARDSDADQVAGLETGAEAYVVKPFSTRVLLAHIRTALRRSAPAGAPVVLRVADLVIDAAGRRVAREGCEVPLTAADFDLLLCFATSPQRVLSRDALMKETRGRALGLFDRTIDVQVSRLRHKLDTAGSGIAPHLRAVRNAGYILALPVEPVEGTAC